MLPDLAQADPRPLPAARLRSEEKQYTGPAVSAFQRMIRGDNNVLRDHICKEMNELNLERCRCIPKNTPGADWRVSGPCGALPAAGPAEAPVLTC